MCIRDRLRLSSKYHVYIQPHLVGPGLRIVHIGGAIHINCKKMGEDCTVSAGVIIGKNKTEDCKPEIGNNCDFSIGCKVIGKVKIGNNCTVAPNSVVVKDIPDNCIASGVPSKIISCDGMKIFSFYQ